MGERDAEAMADRRIAQMAKRSAIHLAEFPCNVESQSGSLLLGREERLEKVLQYILRNTRTGMVSPGAEEGFFSAEEVWMLTTTVPTSPTRNTFCLYTIPILHLCGCS